MKKKDYYIIGAGGFAKEVYYLAEEVFKDNSTFKGFIAYEPKEDKLMARGEEKPILDEKSFLVNIKPSDRTSVFMGVGNPQLIKTLSRTFEAYNFPNLIHHSFIGDKTSIELGSGNIITAGCIFTVDIKIGSFNIFNLGTTVGHDVVIGNCNVFNPACNISGEVEIGSGNLFGVNSTVLQQLEIKNDAILGGASLSNKSIDNDDVMVGIPAKKINKNAK